MELALLRLAFHAGIDRFLKSEDVVATLAVSGFEPLDGSP